MSVANPTIKVHGVCPLTAGKGPERLIDDSILLAPFPDFGVITSSGVESILTVGSVMSESKIATAARPWRNLHEG